MRRPGEVLSRFALIEQVWDESYEHRSNVVDAYVRLLRDKIDRPFGTDSIETVRGVGYRLCAPSEQRLNALPLRVRLTLAYTGAMAVVLALVGGFLFLHTSAGIDQGIDDALAAACPRRRGGGSRRRSRRAAAHARPPAGQIGDYAQVVDAGGRDRWPRRRRRRGRCCSADELRAAQRGRIVRDRGESLRVLAEPVGTAPARGRRRRRPAPARARPRRAHGRRCSSAARSRWRSRRSPATRWPRARCAPWRRCAAGRRRSPPPTPTPGCRCPRRATRSAAWEAPSTRCWRGWPTHARASAPSSRTPATSCARR